MANINRSGTYVHVHAYGESEDPVTGRTVRTPIGTVEVPPNEAFPDWAEPGQDFDEALLESPEDKDGPGAMGFGMFPFDLDRQVAVREQQEQEDRERSKRADNAAQVAQAVAARRSVDSSPEKSAASGDSAKAKSGAR